MSLALITVHGDYLSTRVSFSFLPTLGEVNEAVTPLFPNPRHPNRLLPHGNLNLLRDILDHNLAYLLQEAFLIPNSPHSPRTSWQLSNPHIHPQPQPIANPANSPSSIS